MSSSAAAPDYMFPNPVLAAVAAIARRSLGDNDALADDTDYSDRQLVALKATSLAVGALSIASAIVTFCWFVRMRRSFRHE